MQPCRNCGSKPTVKAKRDTQQGWSAKAICCGKVETHGMRLRSMALNVCAKTWDTMQLADGSGK